MCDDYKVKIDREQIAINDIQSLQSTAVYRTIKFQRLSFQIF